MSVDNFIPEIWSQRLLMSLKKNLVGRELVNSNYQGEITEAGDTVKIQTPGSINVEDYDGSDITFQDVSSSTQSLLIDIAKSFSFTIDDVDQLQATPALIPPYTDEASFSLSDEADQLIFAEYTNADSSNVIAAEALTASNIYGKTVESKKLLSKNDVPSMNRWQVFSPDEIALLEQSDEFTAASDLGDETKRTGFAGRVSGLEVFESNNVTEAADVRHNPFGYTGAITFAEQLVQVKAGEHEAKHADYVKGLHVYGIKTVRSTALGDLRNDLSS